MNVIIKIGRLLNFFTNFRCALKEKTKIMKYALLIKKSNKF